MQSGVGTLVVLLPPLLLGGILGALGGLFGIGAGVIAIPALTILFGMNQQLAQGTALLMMLPNVLIGFWRYWQRNPFPLHTAGLLGLATMLTTYPAARIAVGLNSHLLKLCFATFLACLSIYSIYTNFENTLPSKRLTPWNDRFLPIVGVIGGIIAGLFTAGAGIVAATIFVRGFGKRQTVAQGLALALVVPGTLIALSGYAQAQQVDWQIGLPLACGGITTVSWGVTMAHRLPEARLRTLFAFLLLAAAVLMFWQGLSQ